MNIVRLFAQDIFDTETEAHYAFYSSLKNVKGIHYHDFFEIFLITQGSVIHHVNSQKQHLKEGALVFVRPGDVHCYEKTPDEDCQFINLAFPKETIYALFEYLGEGLPKQSYLSASLSPFIILSKSKKDVLKLKLENLNLIPPSRKNAVKTELRTLLVEIFTRYFMTGYRYSNTGMPDWLKNVCIEMENKQNFTRGMSALIEITGKSQEHICRTFKKYLNQTPTEFINSLRLDYIQNLLINTDQDILSVAIEAGFENLSHFNHVFKRQFNMSPTKFRKTNRKNILPL